MREYKCRPTLMLLLLAVLVANRTMQQPQQQSHPHHPHPQAKHKMAESHYWYQHHQVGSVPRRTSWSGSKRTKLGPPQ
jgi:hypothetical protein